MRLFNLLTLSLAALDLSAATVYVSLESSNPTPPYRTWVTSATNIQDGVDAALPGDEVLVTNGIYATGGRAAVGALPNRVAVDKPIALRSVNGPQRTLIQGYRPPYGIGPDAVRCVYLTNGATLSGFTLTWGATGQLGYGYPWAGCVGGGVYCESNALVSDCVIVSNIASWGGAANGGTLVDCTLQGNIALATPEPPYEPYWGGAACFATLIRCQVLNNEAGIGGGTVYCELYHCTLADNGAYIEGGAAESSTLNNCTLTANWTGSSMGAAPGCTLNNCILYESPVKSNSWCHMNYCCTFPEPAWPDAGTGNINKDPLLVEIPSFGHNGDLRLQSNSPCINAGRNSYTTNNATIDLDRLPRIVGGTVDIGAYEFQAPASRLSYAWLQQYGLPTDGSADYADLDGDGRNNWQEWLCLTDPTNVLSALHLLSPFLDGTNATVTWESVPGVSYFLERSTTLSPTLTFERLASGIPGRGGTTSYTDTNAIRVALHCHPVERIFVA